MNYFKIDNSLLEYYSIHSINYIMKKSKLKIIDITRNDINGGSIAITAAKQESKYKECKNLINKYLIREVEKKINSKITYKKFYSSKYFL